MLWTSYLDHLRFSHLKSLRGNEAAPNALASNLTLGIALDALAQTSLGFHRFEPVIGIVSPLPWAMLLTRQGISLFHVIDFIEKFLSKIKMSLSAHPACRHADRTISSLASASVRRVVSEDSGLHQSFLLIDCTVRFSLPLGVE